MFFSFNWSFSRILQEFNPKHFILVFDFKLTFENASLKICNFKEIVSDIMVYI